MRLHRLDYLRGLSAFGIMLYHYSSFAFATPSPQSFLGRFGVYGVAIFYVLSGLTLYFVYYQRMGPTVSDLRDFYRKRGLRIFPLMWLTIGLTIILTRQLPPLWKLALNVTGLFSVVDPHAYFATGAWSIGNELSFYLLFPVLVYLAKRSRAAFYCFCGLILGLYLYFAFFILHPNGTHFKDWVLYIHPLNQAFLFVAGFLLGYWYGNRKAPAVVPVSCFFAGILLLILYRGNTNLAAGMNRVVFTAASMLIVFAFYTMPFSPGGWVDRVLSKLGEVSYSVYLLHPVVWIGFQQIIRNRPGVQFAGCVVVTLVVSYFVYTYFELWWMKFGRKAVERD